MRSSISDRRQCFAGIESLESRLCLSPVAFEYHGLGGTFYTSLAPTDVDGDGKFDIVWTSDRSGQIGWLKNVDGEKPFGHEIVIDSAGASGCAVADIDGDGDVDVLSFSANTIAWYENADGRGGFGLADVIDSRPVRGITPADIDGDGDIDVLSFSSESINWYENADSQGNFSGENLISSADGALSIAAADMDGDGDLDVVAASGSTVAWHENMDGRGSFGPANLIWDSSTGVNLKTDVKFVSTADVNSDGDMDVLLASSKRMAFSENTDGLGTFARPKIFALFVASHLESFATADMDGDGDADVLWSIDTPRNDVVGWNENIGRGNYFLGEGSGPISNYSRRGGAAPQTLVTADIDGDRHLDVLFSNPFGFDWFEQRIFGDSNNDGVFNSSDLVAVLETGKYEDGIPNNATFDEGDWNQDGDFNSSDFVLAFQTGRYVAEARPMKAEIAAAIDWLYGQDDDVKKPRGFVA